MALVQRVARRLVRRVLPSITPMIKRHHAEHPHDPKLQRPSRLCPKTFEQRTEPLAKFLSQKLQPGEVLPLGRQQLYDLLASTDQKLDNALFDYADTVTERFFGKKVFFRGIVEFSNVCQKDCGYCGIRKHRKVARYTMSKEEILEMALWAHEHKYGSLMLQSGELVTESRLAFVEDVVRQIKQRTIERELAAGIAPDKARGLGVSISLGELPFEHYLRLREAGAHRYLLRIETSNPQLYKQLHPPDHIWERRVECLRNLRKLGYQVGTGVMIGLPGQDLWDLADDLLFFREISADMIGMGPYIHQSDTPVGDQWIAEHPNVDIAEYNAKSFHLATKMVALARITLGDVNIPATTALQAINPVGREIALTRGANMLMPILTPTRFRENYQLYDGKPCIDESASQCRSCLTRRVLWSGKELHLGEWGDPPHFFRLHANRETV